MLWVFYLPQRSCEGYVFAGVCLSTGGVGIPACLAAGLGGDVLSQHVLQVVSQHALQQDSRGSAPGGGSLLPGGWVWRPPLRKQTATVADGTHPTGMHTCKNKLACISSVYIDLITVNWICTN